MLLNQYNGMIMPKVYNILTSFTYCIKERESNLQWKVITQNHTSLKHLLSFFCCSHTYTHTDAADNTFACDAFLCDVKLAAPGLRGTAQDVCEKDRARGNKGKRSRDRLYG